VRHDRLEIVGQMCQHARVVAALERLARASHAVLLSYWITPKRSYVWTIGAGPLNYVGGNRTVQCPQAPQPSK